MSEKNWLEENARFSLYSTGIDGFPIDVFIEDDGTFLVVQNEAFSYDGSFTCLPYELFDGGMMLRYDHAGASYQYLEELEAAPPEVARSLIKSTCEYYSEHDDIYKDMEVFDKVAEALQDMDVSQFGWKQQLEIYYGLDDGLDVSQYMQLDELGRPVFDDDQMAQIRHGLRDGLDVSSYADPKLSAEEMSGRRYGLSENPGIRASLAQVSKESREASQGLRNDGDRQVPPKDMGR